ncbi:MAG TPA: hypothetical protein VGY76_01585 [Solirubrobacteraceae bacterium]|nr:hypothetical protein [Solirubrobacteraceae bacterium]
MTGREYLHQRGPRRRAHIVPAAGIGLLCMSTDVRVVLSALV